MAREISAIYNAIIEDKNARNELNDLNSTSQLSIYKLWAYVVSVSIFTLELLWDLFREEIDETINSRINGTSEWYASKALEYQDGDDLQRIDNGLSLGYDPVVRQNRIVTRAAYSESGSTLNLKLAKGDADNLEQLENSERNRVTEYFEKIKFAGTVINIISIQPDEIGLNDITVFHDGTRSDSEMNADLNKAMDDFLVNLPFDGIFYIQAFTDALQAVSNVVDVYVVRLDRTEYISGSGVTTEIVRRASLEAGYAIIDSNTSLKLDIEP
tara:strand:- start:310 stop:1119 length:810 start_codon:yes stop_codon:yes gene_type:complete